MLSPPKLSSVDSDLYFPSPLLGASPLPQTPAGIASLLVEGCIQTLVVRLSHVLQVWLAPVLASPDAHPTEPMNMSPK